MKRGQNASSAGSLIGIILLIFIFYIVFLPPEERQKILNEEPDLVSSERIAGTGQILPARTILKEPVGTLDFAPTSATKILIPNAFLEETTETRLLANAGAFTVKTFFGKTKKTIEFKSTTGSAILTFQTQKAGGILAIGLNGKTIFQNRITTPTPILLTNLQETNTITFYAEGGWFESKKYELFDVKIVENIQLKERQTMTHTFTITNDEYTNLQKAVFTYYPGCVQTDVGTISITLNDKPLAQSVPSCDSVNIQEIDKGELKQGKNKLEAYLDKGRLNLEKGMIEIAFTPVEGYLKFFSIPPQLETDAARGRIRVVMKLTMVDDGKTKKAVTNINGVMDTIEQKEPTFERDISRIIRAGNNYVRITPRAKLEVLELEIKVV